jgi:hypothetical protein
VCVLYKKTPTNVSIVPKDALSATKEMAAVVAAFVLPIASGYLKMSHIRLSNHSKSVVHS